MTATSKVEPAVVVRNVTKSFDGKTVLDGVDLDIPAGRTTLLMGENGSGKTIFLSCLAGGLHPTSGTIECFGDEPAEARTSFNFTLQDSLTLPDLTGRENAEFYADLHPNATGEWLGIAERLGIADSLDDPVRDYSGGMIRKLELAIVFGVDVPLYLLDEPTAELDMAAINTVHALVNERCREGKTVVFSSHTAVDVELADKVAFVRDGHVGKVGAPDALLDTVPPVALAPTRTAADALRDHVGDDRLFETNDGYRGFLDADTDEPALPDDIDVTEPSWSDFFNYYVRFN
ncbi:hypothetical protein A4G99_05345 [Haladaptatus sp. R4]|uniref:ABC transporter ATP-binding protein n=1 Tax=Haladaptatus sp. R4 TaxID=1679489 RepID=UPI0007B4DBFD|nr:ABC transporter ATP-binding protein [Haladaptatus sp. R4]KZN25841.1 hypothetical protein A4G99_05345 [Haladaptatus sp. R4]